MKKADRMIYFNRLPRVASRTEFILDECRKKKALHVGCVDSGFYTDRKSTGTLLHKSIQDVAGSLHGVDIDESGVTEMKNEGFHDIYLLNISVEKDRRMLIKKLEKAGGIDVIIAGEVLEHVPDPVMFVKALVEISSKFDAKCIITTPNTFYFGSIFHVLRNEEEMHPDHNFYFSLGTLSAILKKAGHVYDIKYAVYLNLSTSTGRRMIKGIITKMFPLLSDGLIVSFKSGK